MLGCVDNGFLPHRLREYLLSRESLDDYHRAAADRTGPGRWFVGRGGLRRQTRLCVGPEQLATKRKQRRPPPVGQKSEETNTNETAGKGMKQKAP
jgi:hypothetical protein